MKLGDLRLKICSSAYGNTKALGGIKFGVEDLRCMVELTVLQSGEDERSVSPTHPQLAGNVAGGQDLISCDHYEMVARLLQRQD